MKLTALWSPEQQFQHKNGAILTNGKIYIYLAGRTELAQIYVDDDGIHQSQNPVILDDNGRAVVYADEAYSYTAVVCDYYGQEQFSFKPIGLGGPGSEAPKQIDIQSNSLNVDKSYNERTNTETFTLEVKNSDCKSWIGRDGQSSVIPADTEVEPLALPETNEYDGDFIDRIENNNTIFLKEGLYHIDCVMEFTQESGSEENKFGQIEVFTGFGNGDESTNLEINETGPLTDDEVRHCIKQTFIRKVKAGSDLASSELYFRPFSPVPLSSCKIKSLSIVELSITGNTEGNNYYAGEHVQITESNVINVTGLQPSGNYADADIVAQQINSLSGAIEDVSGSIPSIEGLASEQYVDEHIEEAVSGKADRSEIPSLAGYATETWVQQQGYLTSVPDQYATDAEVQAAVSGKADKSEIPSLQGYATETYVQSQVSGKQDELEFTYDSDNKITSIDGHGIAGTGGGGGGSEYIPGQYISIQNDIISVTGLQPSGEYLTQDDLNGYATTQDVEAAVSGKADVSAIPSVAGLASEQYVDEHIIEATSGKADVSAIPSLAGYATESWVNDQGFLKEVPQEYVTDSELNSAISGKADKSEIPSIQGLASETYVDEHIDEATSGKMDKSQSADFYPMASNPSGYLTEHQSLAGYATEQYVQDHTSGFVDSGFVSDYVQSEVSGKQDELQFTYTEDDKISAINGSALAGGDGVTYSAGQYVQIDNDTISVTGLDDSNIFWAIYGTTTYEDTLAAYNAGKRIMLYKGGIVLPMIQKGGNPDRFNFTSIVDPWSSTGPKLSYCYLSSRDGWYASSTSDFGIQADWNQTNSYYPNYIKNKPEFTAPVNADWSATSGLAEILNKPDTEEMDIEELQAGEYISIQSGVISVTGLSGGGGGVLPEGVMNTSGLEYTAGGEISAYNNSAFYDAGLNDLVNQNSGAWGGSGLNVSAGPGIKLDMVDNTLVASLDETVLWNGTVTGVNIPIQLSESLNNFKKVKFILSMDNFDTQEVFEDYMANRTIYGLSLNNMSDGVAYISWLKLSANAMHNTLTITHTKNLEWNSTTTATTPGQSRLDWEWTCRALTRIVGVNRIAGGN